VITGFNTDIEYEGVTYHVQTEDKGLSTPIILSLVYDRGTILASKRSSYEDLLAEGLDENILSERLNKQHRLICAAIIAGRIEDLKRMTARDAANAKQISINPAVQPETVGAYSAPAQLNVVSEESPIPKPFYRADFSSQAPPIVEPLIDGATIIEDEVVLPSDAIAIIDAQEYKNLSANNKLSIEILGDMKFRGGERNTVGFMVSRGNSRKVVTGAQIMVKILGSSFRPVIFHASTDNNGVATVNLQLPSFSTGRAAFLVRAMSDGEEIELRRSIAHG
jgi:hypothetical protein